jgi:FixJ family two-component response regulator
MSNIEAMGATPIAIVDDDASLCRSLARLLRLSGYEPCTFQSAEDFLAGERRFACVLLDIQLGGMSGLEMQRAMTARGDATAVIFISAHDEPATRSEAMEGGCAAFFSKTEDGSRILEAIKKTTNTGGIS